MRRCTTVDLTVCGYEGCLNVKTKSCIRMAYCAGSEPKVAYSPHRYSFGPLGKLDRCPRRRPSPSPPSSLAVAVGSRPTACHSWQGTMMPMASWCPGPPIARGGQGWVARNHETYSRGRLLKTHIPQHQGFEHTVKSQKIEPFSHLGAG